MECYHTQYSTAQTVDSKKRDQSKDENAAKNILQAGISACSEKNNSLPSVQG